MKKAALAVVLAGLVGGGVALAQQPVSTALPMPEAGSPDALLVQRGAMLAAIGDCVVCHTAPGGRDFAGGLGLETPFGVIYSSNITPDMETGIGHWSPADFVRAMRKGVAPDGRRLYPAFPYDHFTHVTEADDQAIYAFLMTRTPVHASPPANKLSFPISWRPIMTAWNSLFFKEERKPDPTDRGAYLVDGLGHCGACHTPRNVAGAENTDAALAGAPVDGWYAPALNANSPAPIPWTAEAMAFYLKHGWAEHHGVAAGPMTAVTANLATVPDDDVAAMAAYVVRRMGPPPADRGARADKTDPGGAGSAIYAATCASCHESGRPLPFGGVNLAESSTINGEMPDNAIQLVLDGLPATPGMAAPIMPGFRGALSNAQTVDLLTYLRARFSDQPAWNDVDGKLRAMRQEGS